MDDIVLDHVAIAVNNLEEVEKIYTDLGFKFTEHQVVETQSVETSFTQIDQNSHLELLKSTAENSPIDKFIKSNGQGIHHLCFNVTNLEKKISELKKLGYLFIYDQPKVGANDKIVNFIHPKSSGGVLIELSQNQSKKDL